MFEDAAWDNPIKLSRNFGCDLKHFSTACRNLRDELNNREIHISSNQDLIAIAKGSRYRHRDWWQYVDPAASKSSGKEDLTAIVMWQCENHVLTCRKIRGKWSLLAGYQVEDLIDIIDSESDDFHSDRAQTNRQTPLVYDDELDDVISFLVEENNESPELENSGLSSAPLHHDLDEEDTERSLLKLDRDIEKSAESERNVHEVYSDSLEGTDQTRAYPDDDNRKLDEEIEQLKDLLHDANDQIALLNHQLRIEKDHNLSLQKSRDFWRLKATEIGLTLDSAINEKIELYRRALKRQAEHLESRVNELHKIILNKNSRIKELSSEIVRLTRKNNRK